MTKNKCGCGCKTCSTCCGKKGGDEGLLKFSGRAQVPTSTGTVVTYLADQGVASVLSSTVAPAYPLARARRIRNLAVNVLTPLTAGSLLVEVLKNGVLVPGFSASYGGTNPASGVQVISAGPSSFAPGDRLDVRVSVTDFTTPVDLSATIGA